MPDDPKRIVEQGYDAIAERYAEWAASFESPAMRWVEKLLAKLDEQSAVLELGCGGGGPLTRAIADRHRLLGVDISAKQIERARDRIPAGSFLQMDATEADFESNSFDAVVSLYTLGHVPRAEQAPLLGRIASWLRPGGWLLATMGTAGADDVVEEDWLGAPMFFASFDECENERMLLEAGFELDETRVIPYEEPGHGLVQFMWVLGRKR